MYDADQARRDRNRQLQRRVDSLERQLAQHLRLIGLLAQVAAGPDAEPLQVLDVCEAMDDALQAADVWETSFPASRLAELLGAA